MQNILAVVFNKESEGYQAMTELRQLPATEQATILQMVLVKSEDGSLKVCDRFDSGLATGDDMLLGGLLGGLIGVLGGPVGVLLMGSYGMLAGGLVDAGDALDGEALIEQVAGKLDNGEGALIALAEESDEAFLDEKLGKYDAEIMRFDAAVIADEVEEAAKVEKEMARQARAELRKTKKEDRKAKIEEKRQEIKEEYNSVVAKVKSELNKEIF